MIGKVEKVNTEITNILTQIIREEAHKLTFADNLVCNTLEDFNSIELKDKETDIVFSPEVPGCIHLCDLEHDYRLRKVVELLGAKRCTNAYVYPPGSIMHWHTNSNDLGTRNYFIFTDKRAIFRYIDPQTGETIDSWDNAGEWTHRQFEVKEGELLWHTIWTEGVRFAFGFNV